MKVTLEIDEKYANILAVTVIGVKPWETIVSTHATDLFKHNYISLDKDGEWKDSTVRE